MTAIAEHNVPPTLDNDALKLLFRNALAQRAVKTSAGLLVTKLAAVNRTCLDSIARVMNQLGYAILSTDKIVLKRDRFWRRDRVREEHAIAINRSHFVWMVQWEMLRLQDLTIASKNAGDWHSLIALFQMPSLRVLRCARPLHRRQPRNRFSTSSAVLAADIVKLNSGNIEELDRVPVWKLSEPLPPMLLKKFIYQTQDFKRERLDNLSRCTVDVLEVHAQRSQVPLDFLAGVDANEIKMFVYASRVGVDHFAATEGVTNTKVRSIGFYYASLQLSDVQLLHRFFPNLAEIKISEILSCHRGEPIPRLWNLHEIGQYLASAPAMPVLCGLVRLFLADEQGVTHSWTVENVRDQFGRHHEMRAALAVVPPQVEVSSMIDTDFHHVGESQTKEADKLASQLGFRQVGYLYHKLVTELAPGRELHYSWAVPRQYDSDSDDYSDDYDSDSE